MIAKTKPVSDNNEDDKSNSNNGENVKGNERHYADTNKTISINNYNNSNGNNVI